MKKRINTFKLLSKVLKGQLNDNVIYYISKFLTKNIYWFVEYEHYIFIKEVKKSKHHTIHFIRTGHYKGR